MISYRHHVLSLVAVFLALAVGVALGGGPLSELGRPEKSASSPATAQARQARQVATFGDDFAEAGAATLYGGRLDNHSVSILTMPGADGDVVSDLGAQVERAGGRVAGTYDAQPALVDASEKSLVDTLGSQLATQLGKDTVPADASTYERAGQLIGLALSSTTIADADAESVRQSLAAAGLLNSPGESTPAGLVLVVLGGDTDDAILAGLVAGLADQATGVVVAGDTASAAPSGDLRGLRDEPVADTVATVDGCDTPLGQVTSVLALARSLTVQGGSFGASGADGPVPLG